MKDLQPAALKGDDQGVDMFDFLEGGSVATFR